MQSFALNHTWNYQLSLLLPSLTAMPRRKKPDRGGMQSSKLRKDCKASLSVPEEAPQPSSLTKQVPLGLFQFILDIFRDSFPSRFDSTLPGLIQQVKHHLYERDFVNAFGREGFLEAYAVRWSPTRALAYTYVFQSLPIFSTSIFSSLSSESGENGYENISNAMEKSLPGTPDHSLKTSQDPYGSHRRASRIVCIGAGAGAEIVALGAYFKHFERCLSKHEGNTEKPPLTDSGAHLNFDVKVIDIADWKPVVSKLCSRVTTAPSLPPYASAKSKALNQPLAESPKYKLQFLQQDVLNMRPEDLATIYTNATLVTLMFTLNELYSTSMTAATSLLLSLTMLLPPGALLLVIDSPGSYSTVKLGATAIGDDHKKYPMQWLLDHTMLESAAIGSSKNSSSGRDQWEKLETRESDWFRLPKGLKYPIDLEDMRYQLHLYRRL